ncbi:MAG: DUF2970 domain-containing protein [Gammaproteobacteria bacterium]|nr:DUF2970 domain-containing protein [Gammaproteobacteria bacterium]
MTTDKEDAPRGRLSILQVAQSVIAASIGVQSNRNRERDFRQGSAKTFIIAGLIGTLLFILTVYTVVSGPQGQRDRLRTAFLSPAGVPAAR